MYWHLTTNIVQLQESGRVKEHNEIKSLICIIDKENIDMDFAEGESCIRLTGFYREAIDENTEAVETFTVDIQRDIFFSLKSRKGNSYIPYHIKRFYRDECYILLKFYEVRISQSYYYRSYVSLEENPAAVRSPIYFEIVTLAFAHQYNNFIHNNQNNFNFLFRPPSLLVNKYILTLPGKVTLHSYHVGQGMCALMHNGSEGFLIDCGAGTPIKQPGYSSLRLNKIIDDLSELTKVSMILSHFDSDHHRLLSWDSNILSKISDLYVPANVSAGLIKDVAIKPIVKACTSLEIILDNGILQSYRTIPHNGNKSKNNNALVSIIYSKEDKYLLPGDYVYSKIASDGNIEISNLAKKTYCYVVVPHHGDDPSSIGVFKPSNESSIAYFSAGNHSTYLHPRPLSLNAHRTAKYKLIVDNNNDQIDHSVTFNF